MKDLDDSKAPLIDHLIELRRRLLWSVAALGAAFVGCLYVARPIFAFLVQPLLKAGQGKIIYTDIFEAFFVEDLTSSSAEDSRSSSVEATRVGRAPPVGRAEGPEGLAPRERLLPRRPEPRLSE